MKRYKLNITDNNHRIGFVFPSIEQLSARIERMQEKVQRDSRKIRIEQLDSDAVLEISVFVQ